MFCAFQLTRHVITVRGIAFIKSMLHTPFYVPIISYGAAPLCKADHYEDGTHQTVDPCNC